MAYIEFSHATIRFSESFSLLDINWKLEAAQVWAITGTNGAGKSSLAASLTGIGEVTEGTLQILPARTAIVSLEAQAQLIERERLRDDSDITDKVNEGTLVQELFDEVSLDPESRHREDKRILFYGRARNRLVLRSDRRRQRSEAR